MSEESVQSEPELPVNDEWFLAPVQKYKIYNKFPYKLIIHTLLVIFTTLQVVKLLFTTRYTRAQERFFYNMFLQETDKTDIEFPRYKFIFTVNEWRQHIQTSVHNYYNWDHSTFETISYLSPSETNNIILQVSYLKSFDGLTNYTHAFKINNNNLGPFSWDNSDEYIKLFISNVSKIELNYTLQTLIPNYYADHWDCYKWSIDQIYSFAKRGNIDLRLNIQRTSCDNDIIDFGKIFTAKFFYIHLIVLFLSIISFVLVCKYFLNMFKLYWRIQHNYINNLRKNELNDWGLWGDTDKSGNGNNDKDNSNKKRKKKHKNESVNINAFINKWSLISLFGNIIQIFSSGISLFDKDNSMALTEFLISLGCLFAYINIGKYLENFKDKSIIFWAIQIALPTTWRIFVGVLPIFLGFTFFATCVFWKSERFSSLSQTIASLYAIMNGDVMLDVLRDMKEVSYVIGQVFGYTFCIMFVVVVMNVFLSSIGEAYVKSKMTMHNHWIYSYMKWANDKNEKEFSSEVTEELKEVERFIIEEEEIITRLKNDKSDWIGKKDVETYLNKNWSNLNWFTDKIKKKLK